MITVKVSTSRTYDIRIGSGLLQRLGQEAAQMKDAKTVCIVSETNVAPLYADTVRKSLEDAGFRTVTFIFPAGESSKNGTTYLELLNFLATSKLTRSDLIVALGGGVVGDLAGFAAATYLRGIRFIQVPTTLLAAVDSSVGGKTAIDLPAGKNLAGAFSQPSLVLCDIQTLNTLPEDVFRDGCAEVIKYSILYDKGLFDHLLRYGPSFDREAVIQRCVELKRDVVMRDEFDTGERMILNFGHTFGHAVEKIYNYETYTHGEAVAIGMLMITRATEREGYTESGTADKLEKLLAKYNLIFESFSFNADEAMNIMALDKKSSSDVINYIFIKNIGNCEIVQRSKEDKFIVE